MTPTDDFSPMAHLLGGGYLQGLGGGLGLLHAPQGGLNAVNDPSGKNLWPLVHGLVAHANGFCSGRDRATKLLYCLGFIHATLNHDSHGIAITIQISAGIFQP
jgi:hypothetical protein